MGLGGLVTSPYAKKATGRKDFGSLGARTPAIGGRHTTSKALGKHYGGKKKGGRGGKGKAPQTAMMTTGYQAPEVKKIDTKAKAPAELTDYMNQFKTDVLGGYKGRLEELRDKGGAFMEEFRRQGRESVEARVEEARRRAAEQGVPFDEAAATREAMQSESGAAAEGLAGAEERIDRTLAAQTGAYSAGVPIVGAPSQTAMQQKAQSLSEQQALMDYWLGKESAATARASAAAQQQQQWMSMLSSMLNSMW